MQSGHVDFFARFGWYKQQVKGHFQMFTLDFFKNVGSLKVLEGATLMEKIFLKVGVHRSSSWLPTSLALEAQHMSLTDLCVNARCLHGNAWYRHIHVYSQKHIFMYI